jgi:hypothetical protein
MRSQIVIRGGRDPVGYVADDDKHLSRPQDVAISIRDKDGKLVNIPGVRSLILRVGPDRKAIATCEIEVDDVDVTAVWLEEIRRKA